MTRTLVFVPTLCLLLLSSCKNDQSVTVFHAPPAVAINLPADGSVFTEDDLVTFQARVDDDVDGPTALQLTWTSDRDGVLDTAPADSAGNVAFATGSLSAGEHVVTLQATNSNAESAEDYVGLTIEAVDQEPTIRVRSPIGSDYGVESLVFPFEVSVSDNQDAAPDLLVWFESDLDGVFCEPVPDAEGDAVCSFALSPGDHVLTFGVEDSGGNTAEEDVDFYVVLADESDDDHDGYREVDGDCDDTDPSVKPGATEYGNGVDDDCDGEVDEGTTFYDDDGDCACEEDECNGSIDEACDDLVGGDCDDEDPDVSPDAVEVCNWIDDDCDGVTDGPDSDDVLPWYADSDGDYYGDHGHISVGCTAPSGYVANDDDCDDSTSEVSPAATEWCNDIDDDCDGEVDEASASDASTWYADADSDGFGSATSTTEACTQPTGYVDSATDCNDANSEVNPDATELCDSMDNDCDGTTDESDAADAPTWYVDSDGDGYGSTASTRVQCSAPGGYAASATDCDDSSSSVHPGATETCNEVDDDCDSTTDEGVTTTYYLDGDGDGYGTSTSTTEDCSLPGGYSTNSSDCDDSDASLNPETVWYRDSDSDSYGDSASTRTQCLQPTGYVDDDSDCNDLSSSSHPGATESCDGDDNDCDGSTDEMGATGCTYYFYDYDGDGYGTSSIAGRCYCEETGYYRANNTSDCYDYNTSANPAASAYFTTSRGDGSYDYNCDGSQSKQYTDNYDCTGAVYVCVDYTNGWSTSSDPACGATGTWKTGCDASLTSCSSTGSSSRTQGCR